MDVEGLLQNVIRFSNYMTARLLVAGVFFYVMAGFVHLGDPTEGILPNLDLLKSIIENYQSIFDILGVSDFALVLIVFLFITAIHITYIGFDRIGYYIPPAIVPLPGWDAIEDLTQSAFDILREARGEEHTDAENQRLFEFRRKLENIDERNEDKHREELQSTNAAFRISKSMMVFALIAWLVALIGRDYHGDPSLLLVIFLLAAAIFVITMIAINRAHYERIDDLRTEVIQQLLGFTSIWAPAEYQARMATACVPSRDLKPASFKVLMPVYGTFDAFARDMKRLGDAALTPANSNVQAPVPAAPLMQPVPVVAESPKQTGSSAKPKHAGKKSRKNTHKKQRN